MKKFILLFVVSSFFISCKKESQDDTVDTQPIAISSVIDSVHENDFEVGFRTSSNLRRQVDCEVIMTSGIGFPKIITVDYGTGCQQNNVTKKGKLKITLSNPLTMNGATLVIERENFFINTTKIEGKVTYTNLSNLTANEVKWKREVLDGKITHSNGSYTFTENRTVTQTAGVGTLALDDNIYSTEGSRNIQKSNGEALFLSITSPLITKTNCSYISQGKIDLEGTINGTLDYGDSTCDNKAIFTGISGKQTIITLSGL